MKLATVHSAQKSFTALHDTQSTPLRCGETSAEYCPFSLYQLFNQQANACKNQNALRSNQQVLTYGELKTEVKLFASILSQKGVEVGDVVSIAMSRSISFIIIILACFKVGATVNLIDSKTSFLKVKSIIEQVKSTYLISNNEFLCQLSSSSLDYCTDISPHLIDFNLEMKSAEKHKYCAPQQVSSGNIAQSVIIYDPIHGLSKLDFNNSAFKEVISKISSSLGVSRKDKMLLTTSCYQPRFLVELFLAFSNAMECVLLPPSALHHSLTLQQTLNEFNITIYFSPKFVWSNLFDIGFVPTTNFKAILVRDYMRDNIDLELFSNYQQVLYYDDFIDSVLCSGLNTPMIVNGQSTFSAGNAANYQPPQNISGRPILSVAGLPATTAPEEALKSGDYINNSYGDINKEPRTFYVNGVKVSADEIEYILCQHPAVSAVKVIEYENQLKINVILSDNYTDISAGSKFIINTDNPPSEISDDISKHLTHRFTALSYRLNNYLANNLAIGVAASVYIFNNPAFSDD